MKVMKKIIIETQNLKRVLENVKHGVSKEKFRPVFTGICMEVENLKLTMITCDGYKLFTDNCNITEGDEFKVVVPIFEIPKNTDKEVIIEVNNEFITFDFGEQKQSYKIIKGEYIDYKPFFNKTNTFSIIFNAKYLQQALKSEKGEVLLEFSDDASPVFINNKKLVLPIKHKKG